jgi:hypothetical protein
VDGNVVLCGAEFIDAPRQYTFVTTDGVRRRLYFVH